MAIIHVKVIDATGKPAMSEMTVIINGDRISEIGKNDQFRGGRWPGYTEIGPEVSVYKTSSRPLLIALSFES